MTTALFLGRFQPPHVGHLLTISRLAQKYDRVIVGVTECEPSVMPVENVISILELLLQIGNITFIKVRGSVEGGTAVIDCEFDVCCSGNPAVLSIMKGKGYEIEFVERAFDSIFSGTKERQNYIESAISKTQSAEASSLSNFALVPLSGLRPIEKINPKHFQAIEDDINACGIIRKPLIIDKVTMAVLDGSHRYAFLLKHGCELAPVLLCDYDDESIFVGTHLGHRFEFDSRKWISKKHVRATAISGQLYEPRTTRHFFPFRKVDVPTSLNALNPSNMKEIDHLVAHVSAEEEIASNNDYINELQHELDILKAYSEEQVGVLKWLEKQNAYISNHGNK